ncbi:MAG: metallophosphoesterase [Eggerthellaceae bacterium]
MLYFTGDVHGFAIESRLSPEALEERGLHLTENDYLIVCGDFSVPWDNPISEADAHRLELLECQPWTTLFIDGNHENHTLLNSFPKKSWHGGRVHEVRPKVLHLMRGHCFDIDGVSVFALGGARSVDRARRKEGEDWWPEELPGEEELATANKTLTACGNEVDVIVTHCAPSMVQYRLSYSFERDSFTEYLEYLSNTVRFKRWYFGHYHMDRDFNDGYCCLLDRVVPYEG